MKGRLAQAGEHLREMVPASRAEWLEDLASRRWVACWVHQPGGSLVTGLSRYENLCKVSDRQTRYHANAGILGSGAGRFALAFPLQPDLSLVGLFSCATAHANATLSTAAPRPLAQPARLRVQHANL